mmetsp:Transcript_11164/g.27444  ORF Transcript_11164/g.27444 Transcript_11164/m.27444 type:complete len:554 (+) Transcript_11164:160-1821(+)
MAFQRIHMHHASIANRFQYQLQSIVPRALAETVPSFYVGASRLNKSADKRSSSTLPCIEPRQSYIKYVQPSSLMPLLRVHGRLAPGCSLMDVKRQFSTAVATEYSTEVDNTYDDMSLQSGYREGTKQMPRLQALRERLRLEKHQGGAIRQDLPPSVLPLEGDISRPLDEHMIDYSTNVNEQNILIDTHGRHHNYLRISLSERCNLRCQYCMPPEGVPLSPSSNLLTNEEIMRLVRLFAKNGVDKVRLTGGEPLLRPNLVPLVRSISDTLSMSNNSGDEDRESGLVGITTNGISLSRHIDDLVNAGLTSVNISLDTLHSDRFMEITRRNGLDKVMRAIGDCIRAFREKYGVVRVGPNDTGGSRVKINVVIMKGFNDDELSDFVRMADDRFGGDVDIRFIEWMPFNDNGWNASRFVSYQDMMDKMSYENPLERINDGPNDTTKWWRVQTQGKADKKTRIGFITSMSEHFCSTCNRLRITADGKIKVCLFGSNEKEVSLRNIMRNHQHEDRKLQEEELGKVIHAAVQKKTFALGGHGTAENIAKAADNRPMTLIGG